MTIHPTARQRHALARENARWPETLMLVPAAQWPNPPPPKLIEIWRSRRFLVQVYSEGAGIERLSINRTDATSSGWADGITWDDLQACKSQCGRGDRDAVEVYPRDVDVVNVAKMRHLWVLPGLLPYVWRKL